MTVSIDGSFFSTACCIMEVKIHHAIFLKLSSSNQLSCLSCLPQRFKSSSASPGKRVERIKPQTLPTIMKASPISLSGNGSFPAIFANMYFKMTLKVPSSGTDRMTPITPQIVSATMIARMIEKTGSLADLPANLGNNYNRPMLNHIVENMATQGFHVHYLAADCSAEGRRYIYLTCLLIWSGPSRA